MRSPICRGVVLPTLVFAVFAVFAAIAAAAAAASVDGVLIAPNDSHLQYQGRWAVNASTATTVNSGSRVVLRFHGTGIAARFDIAGLKFDPQIYAYVDGVKSRRMVVKAPEAVLASGLADRDHELMLAVKDVDEEANRWVAPFASALQLKGFVLPNGGSLLAPPVQPTLHMLFLGDSITQGVDALCGTVGSDCTDATADYAWLTATAFGASLEQVGFGAQGVTRGGGGGVPDAVTAFPLNFQGSAARLSPEPNVIVINQGTNDSNAGADPVTIANDYLAYLREVRKAYPDAYILALEPFGTYGVENPSSPAIRLAVSEFTTGAPALGAAADTRTEFVPTRGWILPGDFGDGSLHPSAAGHQKIAAQLIPVITQLTGLQPAVRSSIDDTGFTWRPAWGADPNTGSYPLSEWAQHPTVDGNSTTQNTTYRLIVRPEIGGDGVRLRLTNDGGGPVTFAAATIGERIDVNHPDGTTDGSSVYPGSLHALTVGQRTHFTVSRGGYVWTDPIPMTVTPFEDLAVSLYVPTPTIPTWHAQSYVTQYLAPNQGDLTGASDGTRFVQKQEPIPWLDAVEVHSTAKRAILAIGDSITDGDQAGFIDDGLMDRYARWPDIVARRIASTAGIQDASVINEGINGDLATGILNRIDHDVFQLPGLTDAIIEIGTNDVSVGDSPQKIIDHVTKIATLLHQHGLRVAAATLVPRNGTGNAAYIDQVNGWLRADPSHLFDDGVLDIHKVVALNDTDNWQPQYNSGDFTHPSILGYQAIGNSFDLGFLR